MADVNHSCVLTVYQLYIFLFSNIARRTIVEVVCGDYRREAVGPGGLWGHWDTVHNAKGATTMKEGKVSVGPARACLPCPQSECAVHWPHCVMACVIMVGSPNVDVQLRDIQKQKGGKCFVTSMCVSFYVYLQEQHLKMSFHLPHHNWALIHPRNCEYVIWHCIIMVHIVYMYYVAT